MPVFLAVALAGALGATARYGLDTVFRRDVHHVPWVTLAVNVSGSFLLGVAVTRIPADTWLRPAVTIGLLGGYTTFSTLSLEMYRLLQAGHVARGALYGGGSLLAGLAAVVAGVAVSR